jgi:TP901 family phage tail tape measure protein
MASKTLRVNIVGDSRSAEKSLTNLTKTTQTTQTTMGRVGSALSSVGGGLLSVASKVTSFVSSGANDFADWAGQVAGLQKTMGGTTEDASRLSYQAKILGVDSAALSTGMRFLAKDVAGGGKGLKALGISTKDAQGHIKSMPELLKEVSAKLQGIPPGAQRTAAILKLFGKSGMALTPILTANASQMNDLSKESDQLGYTLDSKATKGVKEHAIEQRRMEAAFKAAKMQLGQALMPVLTDLAKMFAEKIVPLIKQVVDWMKKHQGAVHALVIGLTAFVVVLKAVKVGMAIFNVINGIVRLYRAWTASQYALNLAMLLNPIGLIIIAIVALVAAFVLLWMKCKGFRDFWKAIWKGIQTAAAEVWGLLKRNWKTLMTVILSVMTGGLFYVVTHWRQVWGWVSSFFVAIWHGIRSFFVSIWNGIKSVFSSALNWIRARATSFINFWRDLPGKIGRFLVGMWDGLKNGFKAAINFCIRGINTFIHGLSSITGAIGDVIGVDWSIPDIPELATGGTLSRGGLSLVGEKGPELLNLPGGASVIPLARGGGGGPVVNVTVNVAGHVKAEKDLAAAISGHMRDELLRIGKRNGGRVGLA